MAFEILGTAASLCVLGSFLLNGEMSIRAANLVGAVLFVIYGALISSLSVTLCNAALIVLQIVKLIQIHRRTQGAEDSA